MKKKIPEGIKSQNKGFEPSLTIPHEEAFLNAFISIAKKGIAEWERTKTVEEKEG
jgi:hypothetical protein